MTEFDYSLERFPPEAEDWFEMDLLEREASVDLQAENAADRTNQAITNWIERKALTSFGIDDHFMPDHSYVGVTETEFVDDLCSQKYEVGFFPADVDWRSPPKPTLTLYVWRTQQLGFGIIWSSIGFRCQPIDDEEREQVYQRVGACALSGRL